MIGAAAGGVSAAQSGGNIAAGIAIGAIAGGISGGTIGSASAAGMLKASAWLGMASSVTRAMPGDTWGSISAGLGYAAAGTAAVYTAYQVGVGVKNWATANGQYFDVATKESLTRADVAAKYGESGAKIYTNGVRTDWTTAMKEAAIKDAKVLFYNASNGPIADFTESALGWMTGTESMSRELGKLATEMRVDLVGYSQGAMISSNAMLYAGLHGGAVEGSSLATLGSPLGSIRQNISAAMAGVTNVYGETNPLDPIRLLSSGLNPFGYLGGALGLATGGGEHSDY